MIKCKCKCKGAHKATLPPLSSSDHNCINLIPCYSTELKRGIVQTKTVKSWTDDAIERLRGYFDCTIWNVFMDSSVDIDELNDEVSSWVTYCVDSVIPEKVLKIYPNSKPWVSRNLKCLLIKKRTAFQ